MSIKALNWAEQQELVPARKAVLLLLANRANRNDIAFPSVAKLAKGLKRSRRHIQNILDELEDEGLIKTEPRTGKRGRQTSNEYTLLIPEPSATEQREKRITELREWELEPDKLRRAYEKDLKELSAVHFMARWEHHFKVLPVSEVLENELGQTEI